jgi:hypothetical protein
MRATARNLRSKNFRGQRAGGRAGHHRSPCRYRRLSRRRPPACCATTAAAISSAPSRRGRKEVIPLVEKHDGLLWYMCPYEGFEANDNVIYTGGCPNQHLIPLFEHLIPRFGRRPYLVGANYVWGWEMNRLARELIEEAGGEVLGERYLPLEETAVDRIVPISSSAARASSSTIDRPVELCLSRGHPEAWRARSGLPSRKLPGGQLRSDGMRTPRYRPRCGARAALRGRLFRQSRHIGQCLPSRRAWPPISAASGGYLQRVRQRLCLGQALRRPRSSRPGRRSGGRARRSIARRMANRVRSAVDRSETNVMRHCPSISAASMTTMASISSPRGHRSPPIPISRAPPAGPPKLRVVS